MNVTMDVCISYEPLGLLACYCNKLSSQCVYEMKRPDYMLPFWVLNDKETVFSSTTVKFTGSHCQGDV